MVSLSTEALLSKVKQLCLLRGVRCTSQRLVVLRLIIEHGNAISAYDLLDKLKESEPNAKPPTIYRALDFLLEQGFIHKIESTNTYIFCHHFDYPNHTSALFICDKCQQVTEHHVEGIATLLKSIADESAFSLTHSVVESHGLCAKCHEEG